MSELIAHLFGDYVLQNHWMANKKTSSSVACLIHVFLYTICFLFVTRSIGALAIIYSTHFFIDRFSLAKKWPEIYGKTSNCFIYFLIDKVEHIEPAPAFISVWIAIIVDNTFHLLINHLAIAYIK
jgi:Protein of unknown function (DUF3307)